MSSRVNMSLPISQLGNLRFRGLMELYIVKTGGIGAGAQVNCPQFCFSLSPVEGRADWHEPVRAGGADVHISPAAWSGKSYVVCLVHFGFRPSVCSGKDLRLLATLFWC